MPRKKTSNLVFYIRYEVEPDLCNMEDVLDHLRGNGKADIIRTDTLTPKGGQRPVPRP